MKYYHLGVRDAKQKNTSLYAVLVLAEEWVYADNYARGWREVTGNDLTRTFNLK